MRHMFDYRKYTEIKEYINVSEKNTKIIAISKNHPKTSVLQAISHGVREFGENRVQEAKEKFNDILPDYPNLSLHLTGPLQTNKVKQSLKLFSYFHTLDREKLAIEFSKNNELIKDKKFFIQVNTGREINKSGIFLENLDSFYTFCKEEIKLNVIGLMCIPPIDESPKEHFKILKEAGRKFNLENYSMGMSGDYIEAVDLNSTYIRLGTVLFGKRK